MSFFDKLVNDIPIVGNLLDPSGDQALQQYQGTQDLYSGLQVPGLQNYQPAAYTPEAADANTVSEDPSVLGAQHDVLMKMAGLSTNGLSDVDNAGFERARQEAGQIANSGNAAAMQNAEARGVGGSGLEFAMRDQANQDAAQRAQEAGLQQAADSARQRAMYTAAYGNALAGVRGQDLNAAKTNADILNQFSLYNTGNQNQARMYNTGQQNYAQQYDNSLKQQGYQDQLSKAGGEAAANAGVANAYYNQGAANQAGRNTVASLAGGGMAYLTGGSGGPSGGGGSPGTQSFMNTDNTGDWAKKYGDGSMLLGG